MRVQIHVDGTGPLGDLAVESENEYVTYADDWKAIINTLLNDASAKVRRVYEIEEN